MRRVKGRRARAHGEAGERLRRPVRAIGHVRSLVRPVRRAHRAREAGRSEMATEPTAGRAMARAPGGDTRDPTRPVIPDAVFCAPCRVGESFGGLGVFTTAAVKAGSIMHVERPFEESSGRAH